MGNAVLIIGESGTGKSRSIKFLSPETTAIISITGKPLPFKGWKSNYNLINGNDNGNYFISDNFQKIRDCIKYFDQSRTEIKTIVIDDFQYLLANEFMRRHSSCGKGNGVFALYNDIADHAWTILNLVTNELRDDLNCIVLSHNEVDDQGKSKIKTIGKMLNDKICIEGMFTTVLNTALEDGNYYFETQNNGYNTSKSPEGMFDALRIENNLQAVIEAINEYERDE